MRLLMACATLHVAISFIPPSQLYDSELSPWHRGQWRSLPSSCDNQHNSRCCRVSNKHRSSLFPSVNHATCGGRKRGRKGFVRRSVGEDEEQGESSANMDDSDDDPVEDSEIYASLRARLVELETKAALEQQQQQKQQVEASRRSMSDGPRSREVTAKPSRSPEERRRSVALLTIQSVGIISVALLFGTAVLYWLAGDYFVHFGPRTYPGASPRSKGGIERSVDVGWQEEEEASGTRRGMGGRSTTRDPFHFEGFPDVSNSPAGVKSDF